MGLLTVTYYLWTTFIAVVVGILLVLIIKPGYGAHLEVSKLGGGQVITSADALLDLVRYDCPKETVATTHFVVPELIFISAKQILGVDMGLVVSGICTAWKINGKVHPNMTVLFSNSYLYDFFL